MLINVIKFYVLHKIEITNLRLHEKIDHVQDKYGLIRDSNDHFQLFHTQLIPYLSTLSTQTALFRRK